eukprot:gene10604-51401_t
MGEHYNPAHRVPLQLLHTDLTLDQARQAEKEQEEAARRAALHAARPRLRYIV